MSAAISWAIVMQYDILVSFPKSIHLSIAIIAMYKNVLSKNWTGIPQNSLRDNSAGQDATKTIIINFTSNHVHYTSI